MAAKSRLGRQLEDVAATLNDLGVRYALIGGLALASHKVVRATQDIDLLVDCGHANENDDAPLKLDYRCLYRSGEAGNYQRGDERLDFLYASRSSARNLLSLASERAQDLADIRALLRANRDDLARGADPGDDHLQPLAGEGGVTVTPADKGDPHETLDDMMAVIEALCPSWPPRNTFKAGGNWLL